MTWSSASMLPATVMRPWMSPATTCNPATPIPILCLLVSNRCSGGDCEEREEGAVGRACACVCKIMCACK